MIFRGLGCDRVWKRLVACTLTEWRDSGFGIWTLKPCSVLVGLRSMVDSNLQEYAALIQAFRYDTKRNLFPNGSPSCTQMRHKMDHGYRLEVWK